MLVRDGDAARDRRSPRPGRLQQQKRPRPWTTLPLPGTKDQRPRVLVSCSIGLDESTTQGAADGSTATASARPSMSPAAGTHGSSSSAITTAASPRASGSAWTAASGSARRFAGPRWLRLHHEVSGEPTVVGVIVCCEREAAIRSGWSALAR